MYDNACVHLFLFGDRSGGQLMPIGFLELVFNTNVLQLDHFKVTDDLQGKGYGREMYQWLETYAKENAVKRITLHSYKLATGFWEKMGFAPNDLEKGNMIKVLT
ncbi:GNAT family N-acetyltransferase, partial [Candidatus Bathyarchaeota archaeon]|nr:GNAT family N-acetyltransferase [Candidatus Bathyarchaeota archaeon]